MKKYLKNILAIATIASLTATATPVYAKETTQTLNGSVQFPYFTKRMTYKVNVGFDKETKMKTNELEKIVQNDFQKIINDYGVAMPNFTYKNLGKQNQTLMNTMQQYPEIVAPHACQKVIKNTLLGFEQNIRLQAKSSIFTKTKTEINQFQIYFDYDSIGKSEWDNGVKRFKNAVQNLPEQYLKACK